MTTKDRPNDAPLRAELVDLVFPWRAAQRRYCTQAGPALDTSLLAAHPARCDLPWAGSRLRAGAKAGCEESIASQTFPPCNTGGRNGWPGSSSGLHFHDDCPRGSGPGSRAIDHDAMEQDAPRRCAIPRRTGPLHLQGGFPK